MIGGGCCTTVGGADFGFVGRSSMERIITTRNADRAASGRERCIRVQLRRARNLH